MRGLNPLGLLAAAGVLALAPACAGPEYPSSPSPAAPSIRAALAAEGLQVCSTSELRTLAPGAVSGAVLRVAPDCEAADAEEDLLSIQEFDSRQARDAAVRRFADGAVLGLRTTGALGAVFVYGRAVIELTGPRTDDVEDRVLDAMSSLGAS